MRTEQGKRKWVKSIFVAKFAELVALRWSLAGSGHCDIHVYGIRLCSAVVLRLCLCRLYLEMIFYFLPGLFLVPGEKLAILWMALAILEVPGWYALFRI